MFDLHCAMQFTVVYLANRWGWCRLCLDGIRICCLSLRGISSRLRLCRCEKILTSSLMLCTHIWRWIQVLATKWALDKSIHRSNLRPCYHRADPRIAIIRAHLLQSIAPLHILTLRLSEDEPYHQRFHCLSVGQWPVDFACITPQAG